MEYFLITSLNEYGYLGILLLIALENIFPPIPSEVILTFGGFMTTYTDLTIYGVLLFSTLGSVVGAIILYALGRLLTNDRLEILLDTKLVRLLGFKKSQIDKAINLFNKKGKFTVLVARCIPVVRSLISIPAGICKMKLGTFLIYTTAGTLIWNSILIYIGSVAGASWNDAIIIFKKYANILLILAILAFIIGIVLFFLRRNKASSTSLD